MKLNDFFDKIFVINLERRPDRLEIFKQISNDLDFEFEVFKAYDGREIDDNFVYNGKPININPNKHYKDSKGQHVCEVFYLFLKAEPLEMLQSIQMLEKMNRYQPTHIC